MKRVFLFAVLLPLACSSDFEVDEDATHDTTEEDAGVDASTDAAQDDAGDDGLDAVDVDDGADDAVDTVDADDGVDVSDGVDAVDVTGPDFDSDACGVWGLVRVEDPDEVDIDPDGGDAEMDGAGDLQLGMYYPDTFTFLATEWWYLSAKPYPESLPLPAFSLDEDHYYCIPEAFLIDPDPDITEGWVMAVMYDRMGADPSDSNQLLPFRALMQDPVDLVIGWETVYPTGAGGRADSYVYWDGTLGRRIDIDLVRRTSKYNGTIDFVDFTATPVRERDGRVCVYLYGQREPGSHHYADYPFEYLGSNWFNVEDDIIEGEEGDLLEFSVNFAAGKEQTYLVIARYVEFRNMDDSYPCSVDTLLKGSCFQACHVMGEAVGIEVTGDTFSIDPLPTGSGTRDPVCTIEDFSDLCPE